MYPLTLNLSRAAFVEETGACEYTNTSEAKAGLQRNCRGEFTDL
jgi:hypothetical protein